MDYIRQISLFIIVPFSSLAAQSGLDVPRSPFDDQIVVHAAYKLGYAESHEQARWVGYELTLLEVQGDSERKDNFRVDPKVLTGSATPADYKGSGYDRGHLAPAADMKLSDLIMSESFYMSNMSPQDPGFNRGIWKKLEENVREWASSYGTVYVVTGPIFQLNKGQIGANQVTVPGYYYKVILVHVEESTQAIGFILPNRSSAQSVLHYAVSVDEVEVKTQLDFFSGLPDDIEEMVESSTDFSTWNISGKGSAYTKPKFQCKGKTQKGLQCKRAVKEGDQFCYQHKPSYIPNQKTTTPGIKGGARCAAITQKGAQCKRKAQAESSYCWQHKN